MCMGPYLIKKKKNNSYLSLWNYNGLDIPLHTNYANIKNKNNTAVLLHVHIEIEHQ